MGGEILVSQTTFEEVESLVEIDRVREVWPKGFEAPLQVHRGVAIRGMHELDVPPDRALFAELDERIHVRFAVLDGKAVSDRCHDGHVSALSSTGARIRSDAEVHELADLRIELVGVDGAEGVCYAKVVDRGAGAETVLTVRFSTRSRALDQRRSGVLPERSDESG